MPWSKALLFMGEANSSSWFFFKIPGILAQIQNRLSTNLGLIKICVLRFADINRIFLSKIEPSLLCMLLFYAKETQVTVAVNVVYSFDLEKLFRGREK